MTDAIQTGAEPAAQSQTALGRQDVNPMTGFALLRAPAWEPQAFKDAFKRDWGVDIEAPIPEADRPLIFNAFGSVVVVGMQRGSVPNAAAERAADHTDDWPEAAQAADEHLGYVIVAAVPETASLAENARTCVKALASLAEQANVMAIEAASSLKRPDSYRSHALLMQEHPEFFPARNVIYFGIWKETEEGGLNGCTVGMSLFGLPEVEVVESSDEAPAIKNRLLAAVLEELQAGHILKDGDLVHMNGCAFRCALGESVGIPGTKTLQLEPQG